MSAQEKLCHSRDYADGFAAGMEYINDSAISGIEVVSVNTGRDTVWVVRWDDDDDKGEEKQPPGQPLSFDAHTGRYKIGDRELHCGECFQLCASGQWYGVRIELGSAALPARRAWYLVGLPKNPAAERFEGCPCRFSS